jgi:epoxyqueuosine reductase QueG
MGIVSKLLDIASVKRLALEHGFDKVGIVSAEDFDFPAWVHSAIVLGCATLDEAYDYEMYIQYQGQRKWHKPIYTLLEALSARLAHALRQQGCRAEHLTFEDSLSIIDLKKAAVLAGLGTLGLNNVVVNKEYGPRIRFGAVFTDLELEPDRPLDDYYCSSCTICWGGCPTWALGPNGFDRSRCLAEFNPTPETLERQKQMVKFPTPVTRLQCISCLTSCPIGKRLPVEMWFDVRNE